MATVYKVSLEIVSDWVNIPEKQMEELVKEAIKNIHISKMRVDEAEVIKIA